MPRSLVEQACARAAWRGVGSGSNCNPAGPITGFTGNGSKGRVEELPAPFTMEDNPSLTPAIQEYRRLYSGYSTGATFLGEWVQAEGRVYDSSRRTWWRRSPRAKGRNGTFPATTAR